MPAKAKSGPAAAGTKGAGGGGKRPNALQKPLRPSKELAAVVGADPLPRGEVVSKVWAYIKQHGLQDPKNRREILADAKLEPIFGKKRVGMFEMNKHLARHLA
jgi:chromatin remodeling complex protein RSC6